MTFLFIAVLAMLSASFYTYMEDRKLGFVSLNGLRMASWNLAQLGNEASMFDREMALMARGVGDPHAFMLRYDVLWSRYDYLLTSKESLPTRRHQDNEQRLKALFDEFRAMESAILDRIDNSLAEWGTVTDSWESQKATIQNLVIDNFVGDETGQLMSGVEASRDRLSRLRLLTLGLLVLVFFYLALATWFLRKQARVDPVTGLPNGHYLRTLHSVDDARAIVVCDICQYQLVRSEYGEDEAAELTRLFARKLQSQLTDDDRTIAISPSEFAIFARPAPSETVKEVVARLASATRFDWRVQEAVIHIFGVFGAVPQEDDRGTEWKIRYQEAHRALAQAHLEGETAYISGHDLQSRIHQDRQIHSGLIRFFDDEPGPLHLSIVYQPIVSAADQTVITGAEVLLRCQHKDIGLIPPNRVVDICERFGLGTDLGCWLFRRIALETSPLYRTMGFAGGLSINLNPAMLSERLVSDVKALLIGRGIPASALCMEITEDNVALDFERINHLIGQLHDLGVTFALDDFGTGHSSLEYVRELKVDRLKIDRCFVDGIEHSEDKARFLGSVIAMAELAYMKSVVEGVENEAQWTLVRSMGDVLIQGYHAHRPMPFDEFLNLLTERQILALPAAEIPRNLGE